MENQSKRPGSELPTNALGDLEASLTQVIGRIGLNKTNALLQSFLGNTAIKASEKEKLKLLTTYTVSECIEVFNLDEKHFYRSNTREYREGRMACYHLLKKYSQQSYARIGEYFGQKKRNVLYFCHKCDEILSVPKFYQQFAKRYDVLERSMIDFLSKLNHH